MCFVVSCGELCSVAARGVSGMSLAAAVRGSVPAASAVRHMSAAAADGSHPDFEAQRKVPDDDPAAAREVIDKVGGCAGGCVGWRAGRMDVCGGQSV